MNLKVPLMKLRYLPLIAMFCQLLPGRIAAQNLFTEKTNICNITNFCLDCGEPKARTDDFTLNYICERINRRYTFGNGAMMIKFQVVISSTGMSCVYSHTDATHSQLTNELIVGLNTALWKPAMVNGKPVDASVNVLFSIANGKISARIVRMDLDELKPADKAIVFNTAYKYTNPSLNNYSFTSWNKYNSPLADNVSQASLVDGTDILWYGTAHGLTLYNGKIFIPVNESNSPFNQYIDVKALGVDKANNKWMFANKSLYMFNNSGWQIYDMTKLGITQPYSISGTKTGEIFFPNNKGLLILRKGKEILINKQAIWQLPSNDVKFGYYDSRGRLWIGTTKGTIMMDRDQNVTSFTRKSSPIANTYITDATEDEHGNLYFTLKAINPTGNDEDSGEGVAMYSARGRWSRYNDKNSGLPANEVNCVLYDKFEHVLWMGTAKAGLARYDMKNSWENYHNNNSPTPGPDVRFLSQDSKGTLYVSTANGLLMLTRKDAVTDDGLH